MKEAFEEVGRLEVTYLNRFVELLGTIAAVTPLIGLLGTVVGMIDVFRTVVEEVGMTAGAVNPGSLANGFGRTFDHCGRSNGRHPSLFRLSISAGTRGPIGD